MELLIIDDNPFICETISLALEGSYRVTYTGTLQEGQKLVAETDFHVVIVDLDLPGSSIEEVANFILELQGVCPVILMTGYYEDFLRRTCPDLLNQVKNILYKNELSNLDYLNITIANALSTHHILKTAREWTEKISEVFNKLQGI